jgi:hypothetical protein
MRSIESRLLAGLTLLVGLGLLTAGVLIHDLLEAEARRINSTVRGARHHGRGVQLPQAGQGAELALSATRQTETLELPPTAAMDLSRFRARMAMIFAAIFVGILAGALALTRYCVASPVRGILHGVAGFNAGDPHSLIPIRNGRSDLEQLGLQVNRLMNAARARTAPRV